MNAPGSRFVPRAQRFPLPSSILYRPAGEVRWREGQTKNVSRSGVLFHGQEPVDVEMPVEVMLDVPAGVLGQSAGASVGRGRIVRREQGEERPTFAAAISNWEVLPQDPRRI